MNVILLRAHQIVDHHSKHKECAEELSKRVNGKNAFQPDSTQWNDAMGLEA